MLNTFVENIGGFLFLMRWFHVFFGIIWIGILYYFNFVHGAFMGEATTDAATKSRVVQTHLPRAMWWFRWGAMGTFVTGLIMILAYSHIEVRASGTGVLWSSAWINILTGGLLATLMFLNVWLIIWPKQKIIIANAVAVAGGAAANPAVAAAAARAGVASRTNVLFSIPMLFFMLARHHLQYPVNQDMSPWIYWGACFVLVGALELNAIKGKTGPMTTIKGVIHCGFALMLVFALMLTFLV